MSSKKIVVTLLALMVFLVSSVALGAESKFKLVDAIEVARVEVPVDASLLGYQQDNDEMKVVFQDPATFEQYFVKVDIAKSKVKEVNIKGAVFVLGSTVVNKTLEDIRAALLSVYPTAKDIVITTKSDMNNIYYEAEFVTEKFKGEAKFNPATGAVIERELYYY
ncbi:MAG TPA: hypothetical protein IAB06_05700 [Candidatus Avacidaminococcus intestinavium]|uniref:Uncharacterized protein n=1 Tax=Candidatus Avacidaminococcus intestinavium TaxID=2840684 RepID=A0A9D1SLY7_9FIRM|nr:hypothetical protein [Candidatus Avacidaminococcus intestinavium]